ncbi:MAG: hypothetical protein WDN69_27445 [Aliidongia sp.]
MGAEVGGAASLCNGNEETLTTRLAKCWSTGDRPAFYALVVSEAFEKMRRLVMSGLHLQASDAEDCVAQAMESFLDRQDLSDINDPYAYLRRSAWNHGATLHRERRRELVLTVEALSPSAPGDAADALMQASGQVPAAWAVVAVEEAVDDVEADESWAISVVEAALERLTPKQRALVTYLSNLDFDFARQDFSVASQQAAEMLGMRPAAFRKAKQRAYEALELAIPAAIAALQIQPPARFVSAIEDRRRNIPDDEGEGAAE